MPETEYICGVNNRVSLNSQILRFLLSFTLVGIISVISIYSAGNRPYLSQTRGVSIFYFSIVFIVLASVYLGWWGIGSIFLSAFIYGSFLGMGTLQAVFWSFADTVEGLIPFLAIKHLEIDLNLGNKKNANRNPNSIFITIFLFICPIFIDLFTQVNGFFLRTYIVGAAFTIFLVLLLAKLSSNGSHLVKYLLFFAFLPSLVGAFYGSSFIYSSDEWFTSQFYETLLTWSSTNIILIGGFVTPILYHTGEFFRTKVFFGCEDLVKKKSFGIRSNSRETSNEFTDINIDSLIYLVGLSVWTYLFLFIYFINWFDSYSIYYLIPWALGALFLISNSITSNIEEDRIYSGKTDAFDRIEERVRVAEKNTEMILLVLSLILPVATTLIGDRSPHIMVVLIVTATFACSSIVIVWIPRDHIKMLCYLKTVKTLLNIFTISFLLLAAVLISLKIG